MIIQKLINKTKEGNVQQYIYYIIISNINFTIYTAVI